MTRSADAWLAQAEPKPGSWWPDWADWLAAGGSAVTPPAMDAPDKGLAPRDAAPGDYVLQP